MNVVIAQCDDCSPNPPTRHHTIACLELAQHLLPLLLASLVWQDQKEVEDRKDKDQGKKEKYSALVAALKNE